MPEPAAIATYTLDGEEYIGFRRPHVIALIQELQTLLDDALEVPVSIVARAKAISSSPARVSPPLGKGRGAASHSAPLYSAKVDAGAGIARWPTYPVQVIRPPADSIAALVLEAIKAAGEKGVDVAGIVAVLASRDRPIVSEDPERAVVNAINYGLKRKGLVESVVGSRPKLWRAAK